VRALFVVACVTSVTSLGIGLHSPLVVEALVVLALMAVVCEMGRSLPMQNVSASLLLLLSAATLVVFMNSGSAPARDSAAPLRAFLAREWIMPVTGITILLSARAVMRQALRRWRSGRSYGWWLIGLTAALTAATLWMIEPLAAMGGHLWAWPRSRWEGRAVSWMNSGLWFVTSVALLVAATPWLIDKRGVLETRETAPWILWFAGSATILFAHGTHGNWTAVAVGSGVNAALLALAVADGRR
jgi:hypothetical protein